MDTTDPTALRELASTCIRLHSHVQDEAQQDATQLAHAVLKLLDENARLRERLEDAGEDGKPRTQAEMLAALDRMSGASDAMRGLP